MMGEQQHIVYFSSSTSQQCLESGQATFVLFLTQRSNVSVFYYNSPTKCVDKTCYGAEQLNSVLAYTFSSCISCFV